METILLYLGRVLFGGYFVFNGFNHFKMIEYMSEYAKIKKVPMPKLSIAFTGLLLVIGGLSIIFNAMPIIGLLSLVFFLVPVTLMIHSFWRIEDPAIKRSEIMNFTRNGALLGAVLILLSQQRAP